MFPRHQDSALAFGFKICPVDQLEMILGLQPNFAFFKEVLSKGMGFHLNQELSEDQCQAELDKMVIRGKHKSSQ
jgi:hypothetical protein